MEVLWPLSQSNRCIFFLACSLQRLPAQTLFAECAASLLVFPTIQDAAVLIPASEGPWKHLLTVVSVGACC